MERNKKWFQKIPGLKSGSKKKRLIIGFLYFVVIMAVIGMFLPDPPEEAKPESKTTVNKTKRNPTRVSQDANTETNASVNKTEKKKQDDDSIISDEDYKNNSEETVELTEQAYGWFLSKEQNQLVKKIAPVDSGNYSTIIVTVDDTLKVLSKEEKKVLADSWGRSIMNLTNSNIGVEANLEKPYVEFRYSDASVMARPEILGDGWKAK